MFSKSIKVKVEKYWVNKLRSLGIEVESIMVGTLKKDNYLVHLQGFYMNKNLLPNT